MDCKKATCLLSEKQERPLTLTETSALKVHLLMCSACHHFGQQLSDLRGLSRAFAKGESKTKK